MLGQAGDVLGDLLRAGGGDAVDRGAEAGTCRPDLALQLADLGDDGVLDRLLLALAVGQAGEDHPGQVAVRPADVVEQDVVSPSLGGFHGQRRGVIAHALGSRVQEAAAVGAEALAVGGLHQVVTAASGP